MPKTEQKTKNPLRPESPAEGPFRFSVICALGNRYLGSFKGLIAFYILLTVVCRPVLPIAVGLNLSQVTNFFQQEQITSSRSSAQDQPGPFAKEAGTLGRSQTAKPGKSDLLATYLSWLVLSIALVAITALLRYVTGLLDGKMGNAMRLDTFNSILRQSPEFFFQYDQNRLTTVVNQFCVQAQLGVRQLLVDPVLQILGIVIAGWTLFEQLLNLQGTGGGPAWISFLCISLFALISPLLVNSLGQFLQRETTAVQTRNLRLASLVGGAITSYEEVQATRAEPIFDKKHEALLDELLRAKLNQSLTIEKLNALNSAPGTLVLAALLGTAVYLVVSGKGGSPGSVVALALITPQFMNSIQALSGLAVTAQTTWPGLMLVASILARQSPAQKEQDSTVSRPLEGTLEAVGVVFRYPGANAHNVLDGLSFKITAGRRVGFVARPGQGKTTFFRLALRFYDPQQGEILLGGQSVRDLSLATLRTNIGMMSQFPGFFHDTVRDNFRIARPTASDDEIIALCEKTGLWKILETSFGRRALDEPFDAGGRFSGGQRKLFALTRCLLRDPQVLFLDEPTTGMGPLEKYPLIEVMQQACAGRTVVLVDHDIVWQSRFCEQIVVLQAGKVIQEGTPQELRAQDGLFQRLYTEASQQSPSHSTG